MFFGITTWRSNAFVIKPSGYEFSRFDNLEAAFFIPAWFVLPHTSSLGVTVLCQRGNKLGI